MVQGVEFEEDNIGKKTTISQFSSGSNVKGISGFLIKIKLAKDQKDAEKILLVFLIIIIVAIVVIITKTFFFSTPKTSIPEGLPIPSNLPK